MNLTTIRSETLTRLGLTPTDAMVTTSVLTSLVNASVDAIETEHPWYWMRKVATLTTGAGTASYPPPSDWVETLAIYNEDGEVISRGVYEDLADYEDETDGIPRVYVIEAGQITFSPTPTAALSLRHYYRYTAPDLAADSDTPVIPAYFHYAIVAHAAYLGARRRKLADVGRDALAEYQDWLVRMKRQHESESRRITKSVRIRPGGWL